MYMYVFMCMHIELFNKDEIAQWFITDTKGTIGLNTE